MSKTFSHEMFIHGYKVVQDIKGEKSTTGNQDHRALKKGDTKHPGVRLYKSIWEQLKKSDKRYDQEFLKIMDDYQKQY